MKEESAPNVAIKPDACPLSPRLLDQNLHDVRELYEPSFRLALAGVREICKHFPIDQRPLTVELAQYLVIARLITSMAVMPQNEFAKWVDTVSIAVVSTMRANGMNSPLQ